MKLDKKSHEKYFSGFFLTDCVVRKKDILYFVAEQEFDETSKTQEKRKLRTRVITCIDRKDVQPWGYADLGGMHRTVAGVSYQPKEQFVGVTLNDHVYVLGSGDIGFEHDLKGSNSKELKQKNATPEEYMLRGGITKLRTIDGRLYGCGLGRTVIDRVEKNEWHYHTELPKDKSFLDDTGFSDIDGFSSNDIYAVGGHGDVWHFDGKQWKQIAFPSEMTLETVCCAGDGQVYIGAESGTVFKGRDNEWKLISRGRMTLPFKDMVWHQDQLWCTSDYGLWVLKNDKVREADVPYGVSVCAGHLSVGDGVMLLAGMYGAAMHDGKEWHRIIDFSDLA